VFPNSCKAVRSNTCMHLQHLHVVDEKKSVVGMDKFHRPQEEMSWRHMKSLSSLFVEKQKPNHLRLIVSREFVSFAICSPQREPGMGCG
jgi:hypothetical protein